MTRRLPDPNHKSLDNDIQHIASGAQTDDEAYRAWQSVFNEGVALPCDAFVIDEPISVVEFCYDGNPRRGLTARCRRADETTHVVAACDVVLPPRSAGGRALAAYRRWLGLEPLHSESPVDVRAARTHKATASDVALARPVELVLLSVKDTAARCLLLGTRRGITLRSGGLWDAVPGEIVVVKPRKQWSYAGHPYLSGEIQSTRLDVSALDLVPLTLKDEGIRDPHEQYWGESDEPVDEWARPIIARGERREFEMEQVLPGADPDDPESDPITESNDLKDAGDVRGALRILMELCQADLRRLDAHAHLGNLAFEHDAAQAIRHYEAGVRIGELSLASDFDGLLPWGFIDNRPFLRCLHGFGLCCWRLGRFDEAEHVPTMVAPWRQQRGRVAPGLSERLSSAECPKTLFQQASPSLAASVGQREPRQRLLQSPVTMTRKTRSAIVFGVARHESQCPVEPCRRPVAHLMPRSPVTLLCVLVGR